MHWIVFFQLHSNHFKLVTRILLSGMNVLMSIGNPKTINGVGVGNNPFMPKCFHISSNEDNEYFRAFKHLYSIFLN